MVVVTEVVLITGAELLHGAATTVTVSPSEAGLEHPCASLTTTEYVPAVVTEICWAIDPSDHRNR